MVHKLKKKSTKHLKILGARIPSSMLMTQKIIWRQRTQLVAMATWRSGFVHPCIKLQVHSNGHNHNCNHLQYHSIFLPTRNSNSVQSLLPSKMWIVRMQTVTRDCHLLHWKQTPQKHFYSTYFNQETRKDTENFRTERRQKKSLNTTEKERCLSYYAFTSYWNFSSYRHIRTTTAHPEPSLCVSLHSVRKHSIGLKSESNYQTFQDTIKRGLVDVRNLYMRCLQSNSVISTSKDFRRAVKLYHILAVWVAKLIFYRLMNASLS